MNYLKKFFIISLSIGTYIAIQGSENRSDSDEQNSLARLSPPWPDSESNASSANTPARTPMRLHNLLQPAASVGDDGIQSILQHAQRALQSSYVASARAERILAQHRNMPPSPSSNDEASDDSVDESPEPRLLYSRSSTPSVALSDISSDDSLDGNEALASPAHLPLQTPTPVSIHSASDSSSENVSSDETEDERISGLESLFRQAEAISKIETFAKMALLKISLKKNNIANSAVLGAIEDNNASELQRLIAVKKLSINAKNSKGIYAIEIAAKDKRIECLKVLLNNKADPNHVTHDVQGNEKSLISRTAYKGHVLCTRVLKKAGARHTRVVHLG